MYIDNVKDFKKYKVNICLALAVLFLALGISSKMVPSAYLIQKAIVLWVCTVWVVWAAIR